MESANANMGGLNTEVDVQHESREREEECEALLQAFRDEPSLYPNSTTEAQLAQNVERFFQDQPEDGVILEDFREAHNMQLTYYQRRVGFYKVQHDKIRKDRKEAENQVRLMKMEVDQITTLMQSIFQKTRARIIRVARLEKDNASLREKLSTDLTEKDFTTTLSEKEKKKIAEIDLEKEKSEKAIEENKAELEKLLDKMKSSSGALKDSPNNSTVTTDLPTKETMEKLRQKTKKKISELTAKSMKLEEELVKRLHDIADLEAALSAAQDANNLNESQKMGAKNDAIQKLGEEVEKAQKKAAHYLEEITGWKRNVRKLREDIKRMEEDHAAEVKDLKRRLEACLAKHVLPPPASAIPEGGKKRDKNGGRKVGEKGGNDGGNDGGTYGGHIKPTKPKAGQMGQMLFAKWTIPSHPPPEATTLQTPNPKKRKLRELDRLIAESQKFRTWSTKTKRASRTGF